jgi:nucleoid-associated protein YgaU
MTSDAKIGLLLGLVFIFVIAFVINGLPSLRPPTVGKVEVTTMAGEDFEAGIEGKTGAVPNLNELLDQPRTGSEPAPVATEPPKAAGPETPQPAGPLASGPQTSQPSTASDEGVRFSTALSGISKLLDQLPQLVPPNRGGTFSMDTPKPASDQPAASEHQPVAAASQPRVESPSESKPAEMLTKATDVLDPAKPATVASKPVTIPGSKTYVVVAGDTLPAIAKRFYGPEEGNRLANIDRIFQANLTMLKSPAEVYVGQKLVIPPPLPPLSKPATTLTTAAKTTTTPAPNPNKPADMLPKTLFEKVESLGKRAPAAVPPPTPEGRWYTVQDGDKLWKIAATQLGAGSRWDEIYKLNSEILTNQDSLQVGIRLRLPAK